jgi:hypothetical protein
MVHSRAAQFSFCADPEPNSTHVLLVQTAVIPVVYDPAAPPPEISPGVTRLGGVNAVCVSNATETGFDTPAAANAGVLIINIRSNPKYNARSRLGSMLTSLLLLACPAVPGW